MKVRYALPLLLVVALALYGLLWSIGISGPGIPTLCAVTAFFGIGAIRRWWLKHRSPEEAEDEAIE